MLQSEEVLRVAKNYTPFDLPVGVYVITKDGRFVDCNQQVRKILSLPLNGPLDASMVNFYSDPSLRDAIHEQLAAHDNASVPLKFVLPLKVDGREKYVEDYTRPIRNDAGEVLGYICCMVDVTDEYRANRLFESLPVGAYQLDSEDKSVHANKAFARILGYQSPVEIEGRPVKDFYVHPHEADALRELIDSQKMVEKYVSELRKRNGESIFVQISAHKIETPDGAYGGREGTMMDVTREERYRRIMKDVPVGLYTIKQENGQDRLEDCNDQYAMLFGYGSQTEMIGLDVKGLHATHQDYLDFITALNDKARHNQPLNGHLLNLLNREGGSLVAEVNCRALKDLKGNTIGRTGSLRDVTEEAALREKLKQLTYDFGNVLHDYTSTLLMVQLSITSALRAFHPDPFHPEVEVSVEEAAATVASPAARLAASLGQLLERAKAEDRAKALPAERWLDLSDALAKLEDYEQRIPTPDFRPIFLGEVAWEVQTLVDQIDRKRFSRELLRQVHDDAQNLARIVHLISLRRTRDAVLEMDHQVRALREFVTADMRRREPRVVCKVAHLISQARMNLDEYARSRGVLIRVKLDKPDYEISAVPREVMRALANLLHNAIKYSWSRPQDKSPWISIHASAVNDKLQLRIENWGVPIPKDEIEQELVFHMGFRGKLSGDRGRIGTGIGLTDARQVARGHGGDLTLESRPAVATKRDDDYRSPFLTTVTLTLPLHKGKGA
ncbi:MAG TPA: PAS domain S-box protein [Pyrinomonadaceae bacterium]|jgi:PAS domain S-box-containing protein